MPDDDKDQVETTDATVTAGGGGEIPETKPVVAEGDKSGLNKPAPEIKEGDEPEPAAKSPPRDGWKDDRIRVLTAKLNESRDKLRSLEGGTPPPGAPPAPQISEAEIDRRAADRARVDDFNRRCNEAAAAGNSKYGAAFGQGIAQLTKLQDPSDPNTIARYNLMLDAALETGEADRVLFELSSDLDEANRIMKLSPSQMGVAIARRALKPASEISAAPKPIPAIGRRQDTKKIDPDDPSAEHMLSTAEWMKRREAQARERAAERFPARGRTN